ncbi:MAG: HD domain-containing protein [Myxococcota bacterium]
MLLRDPVHGLIAFEHEETSIVVRLLATPEVQRLRRIRQLGLTSLAFVGAEHTRFAHAVGAAHVMKLFVARMRQLHGDLPFWQRLTSERARDAYAAALLHDIGHGPLSHLFEDAVAHTRRVVAERRHRTSLGVTAAADGKPSPPSPPPRTRRHEEWTEQILMDPGTGVHQALVRDDPELPRRVTQLIYGEHPLPYLARAVSGTFDVDRCDYLLRDAHATGVGYGRYDLPWLLSTLRFGIPDEASSAPARDGAGAAAADLARAPGLAIDGRKGLSAIESFILARLFMFQQVYFHKSTRAAEWMIRMILTRAMHLLQDGTRLERVPEALTAIAAGETPTLGAYLELDDQRLLETLNGWRHAADPVLADLCERLRQRDLFKTYELFGERAEVGARTEALQTLEAICRDEGLDPDYYVGLDVARDTPYADDRSLSVIYPGRRPRHPAEVSFVLDRLRDETLSRVRLIFAPELKGRLREALD